MLNAIGLLSALIFPAEVTIDASDDVWVYQFAEDQTTDQYMRVWSSDGNAVGDSFSGQMSASYSCVKFDISKVDVAKITGAKLVLTSVGTSTFTLEDSKKHPIEARALTSEWNEANWAYENAEKVHPSKDNKTIFGTGYGAPGANEDPFIIEIDLMKGPAVLKGALKSESKAISFALTTTLSPEGQGEGYVYKFFSRSNDDAKKPKLVLILSESTTSTREATVAR